MSRSAVLTDAQWARIEPLMPVASRKGGRPFQDHRRVVEGIVWRFRTGAPWRDLPAEFGGFHMRHEIAQRDQPAGHVHDPDQSLVECGPIGAIGLHDRLVGQKAVAPPDCILDGGDRQGGLPVDREVDWRGARPAPGWGAAVGCRIVVSGHAVLLSFVTDP